MLFPTKLNGLISIKYHVLHRSITVFPLITVSCVKRHSILPEVRASFLQVIIIKFILQQQLAPKIFLYVFFHCDMSCPKYSKFPR